MARSPRKHLLRAADELDAFFVVLSSHIEAATQVRTALGEEALTEIDRARGLLRDAASRLAPGQR